MINFYEIHQTVGQRANVIYGYLIVSGKVNVQVFISAKVIHVLLNAIAMQHLIVISRIHVHINVFCLPIFFTYWYQKQEMFFWYLQWLYLFLINPGTGNTFLAT